MAEETLVREHLTDQMVKAGADLLLRLEAVGFEVAAAFWLYNSEAGEWRLTLAWPHFDAEGPRKGYERILDALNQPPGKIPGIDLLNITVVSPNDALVRAMAGANRITPLLGKRLSGNRLNGIYIMDAYIYFIGDSVMPLDGPRWISR